MKPNNNVLQQQSRQTARIPTQPLMLTIGKGDMPRVAMGAMPHVIITVGQHASPANPVGWNGSCWHDGAD